MAADERHLRDGQSHLEEPAYGLMPEVVEPEVLNACPALDPLPSEPEGIGRHREDEVEVTGCLRIALRASLTGFSDLR